MFHSRKDIPRIKWDLSTKTKKIEQHPDWFLFCRYVRTEVPTGEFLFDLDLWDRKWFARTIVEKRIFPVRQEIVEFVNSFGYTITPPKGRFFRKSAGSVDDKKPINLVANSFWIEWRQEAEQKL